MRKCLSTALLRSFSSQKPTSSSNSYSILPKVLFEQEYHIENEQRAFETTSISHQQFSLHGKTIDLIGIPIAEQVHDVSMANIEILSELCFKTETNDSVVFGIDPSCHIADKRGLQRQLKKYLLNKGKQSSQDKDTSQQQLSSSSYATSIAELNVDVCAMEYWSSNEANKERILSELSQGKTGGRLSEWLNNDEQSNDEDQDLMLELEKNILNRLIRTTHQPDINGDQHQEQLNLEAEENWKGQMSQTALLSLLNNQKLILGEVPLELQRIKLANALDLQYLKGLMKEVLQFGKESGLTNYNQLGGMSKQILCYTYGYINDFYTYSVIEQLCKNEVKSDGITVILKSNQVDRIKQILMNQPKSGLIIDPNDQSSKSQNQPTVDLFNECLQLRRNKADSDETLLEKHAILQVLYSDQVWKQSFITNPFPYLNINYNTLGAQDKQNLAKAYAAEVRKYAALANQFLQKN